jgi:hypothetical protein
MSKSTEKYNGNIKRILLSAVATIQIVVLIAATVSSYAYALTIVNTWGSQGSGNGQFNGPSGMDLDVCS